MARNKSFSGWTPAMDGRWPRPQLMEFEVNEHLMFYRPTPETNYSRVLTGADRQASAPKAPEGTDDHFIRKFYEGAQLGLPWEGSLTAAAATDREAVVKELLEHCADDEKPCPYAGILFKEVPGYESGYGCPVCGGLSYHLPVKKS